MLASLHNSLFIACFSWQKFKLPRTEMSVCFVYWYSWKYWSVPEMWQGLSKNLKDVNWVKLEKSWMKIFPKSFLLPVFLTIIFWIECKLWGQEVGVVILNYSLLSFYRRVRLFSLILGPTRLQGDRQFEFWCQLFLWYQMTRESFSHPGECLTASNSWVAQWWTWVKPEKEAHCIHVGKKTRITFAILFSNLQL